MPSTDDSSWRRTEKCFFPIEVDYFCVFNSGCWRCWNPEACWNVLLAFFERTRWQAGYKLFSSSWVMSKTVCDYLYTAALPAAECHRNGPQDPHVPGVLRREHRGQPQTRARNQVRDPWHVKKWMFSLQFHVSKALQSLLQVQLGGQVRLWQALPRPGVLCPGSHRHVLQRDGGGGAELHLEKLQIPGVPGATAEAHQLPEHHHHLPETRQEHVPHHAQLQRHRLPPLVRLYSPAGVEWGYESLYHLHRGPVESLGGILGFWRTWEDPEWEGNTSSDNWSTYKPWSVHLLSPRRKLWEPFSVFRLSTDAVFKGQLLLCTVWSCTSLVDVLFNTRVDKLVAFALRIQVGL